MTCDPWPWERCHREHSKFPENLLRGSEATEGGVPPPTVWSFFVFQCWIVCSGAYFRGYFHIFLHIISVFNWVLGTYCHMVIKKYFFFFFFYYYLFGNFWKSGNFRKCGISALGKFAQNLISVATSHVVSLGHEWTKSNQGFSLDHVSEIWGVQMDGWSQTIMH